MVKHGLSEGELVVTNGNFKLDSALQIQAKPTMMTPEGGGGGGHDHGGPGGGDKKTNDSEMAGATMTLPAEFRTKLDQVVAAFDELAVVVEASRLDDIRRSFSPVWEKLSNQTAAIS